jgi:hypothetical protein
MDPAEGTVTLSLSGIHAGVLGTNAPTAVRYAWADYVDCVLVNSDGLPAGPFVVNISKTDQQPLAAGPSTRGSPTASAPSGGMIQSPPMGTNTWNFYHCNIDENIVKRLAIAFEANVGLGRIVAL